MEIDIDSAKFSGSYTKRNLTRSHSGKYSYPSKKMFYEFLKKYKDVDGNAAIWSVEDAESGEVTIRVELKYKVKPK